MISGSYNCTTSRLPTSPATVGVGPTPPLSQGPPAPSIGLWKKKMKLSVSRASASTKGAVYTEAEAEEEGKLQLQKGIAEFYDESSGLWENIWGDHMHHGFYDPNAASTTTTDSLLSDHRSAQIRMIEEALRFAGVPALWRSTLSEFVSSVGKRFGEVLSMGSVACLIIRSSLSLSLPVYVYMCFSHMPICEWRLPSTCFFSLCFNVSMNWFAENPMKRPKSIVDVGCGIGGSSRYLARKYEAQCQGITLSPVQAQMAEGLAASQGLVNKVSFQVADALNQPFPDAQFDLVWSMESGEHMPDKAKFVNELARVAAPGGTIIIVTWCHRDLSPSEESLRPDETALLKKICDAYYLPAWCSTSDYVKLLQSLSLEDIKAADWSEHVAPFWPAVIRSALTWNGFISLLRSGWKTIKGALVMPLMIQGYRKGLIKFAIITCRKPE